MKGMTGVWLAKSCVYLGTETECARVEKVLVEAGLYVACEENQVEYQVKVLGGPIGYSVPLILREAGITY